MATFAANNLNFLQDQFGGQRAALSRKWASRCRSGKQEKTDNRATQSLHCLAPRPALSISETEGNLNIAQILTISHRQNKIADITMLMFNTPSNGSRCEIANSPPGDFDEIALPFKPARVMEV